MKPMMTNAYQQYKQQDILTASPIELIIMLYDATIKQMKLANLAIKDGKIEQTNKSIQKAQEIITELMCSLDMNYDVSKQLMDIYEFIIRELVDVNITKKTDKIQPLIDILENLKKSWVAISKKNKLAENIG